MPVIHHFGRTIVSRTIMMSTLVAALSAILSMPCAAQPSSMHALRNEFESLIEDEVASVRTQHPGATLVLTSKTAQVDVNVLTNSPIAQGWTTRSAEKLRLAVQSLEFRDSLALLTLRRYSPNNRSSESDATIKYLLVNRGNEWVLVRRTLSSIAEIR